MLKTTLVTTALLAAAWLGSPVAAQTTDFPNKPVRIVVPFPPGGATDITARVVAEKLSTKWGQPVVIDNKAGAGGNVGSDLVAKSAPDGYNIVLGVTGSHSINISLYKKMPYHPLNDFEPLTQATIYPNAIVVNPQVPANTLPELIALLKKEPGKFSYGSDGNGTASHLGMEILKARANVQLTHIPYKGEAAALSDLIAGQIDFCACNVPASTGFIKGGQIKALAVTSAKRLAALPNIPTVAEASIPGFENVGWFALMAPANTPKLITDKIYAAAIKAVKSEAMQKSLELNSLTPVLNTQKELETQIVSELAKWEKVIKARNLTAN